MKRLPFLSFAFLVIVCFSSCSTGKIQTFSEKYNKTNLKNYKTYAWIDPSTYDMKGPRPKKMFGDFILQKANFELQKKGMVIDTLNPDAVFAFETMVEQKVEYTQSPSVSVGVGFAGPGYYVGGSAPIAGGQVIANTYDEGSLIVNMYDTRTKNLIWRGGAVSPITLSTNMEETIQTALHYIFMRLPIKHKN
jgi:hypothetical protein